MIALLAADPRPLQPDPPRPSVPGPLAPPGGPCHNRQQATCPTCRGPVPGLLAGCEKPLCRAADLDYDLAFVRRGDL